jgi:putative transposase
MANILNKPQKNSKAKARQYIQDIWTAENRENAEKAFNHFIKTYELKHPKVT